MDVRERDFLQNWKLSSSSAKASKKPFADRTQQKSFLKEMPKDKVFAIKWMMNEERTLGILKRSLQVETSFTKDQITSVKSTRPNSRLSPSSENQHHKQRSSEFQINLSRHDPPPGALKRRVICHVKKKKTMRKRKTN